MTRKAARPPQLTALQRRRLQALDSPAQAFARKGRDALTRKVRGLARHGPTALIDLLNVEPDSRQAFSLMCHLARRPAVPTVYSQALTGIAAGFLHAVASVAFAAGSRTPMAYAGPREVAAEAAVLFQRLGQRAARGQGAAAWGPSAVVVCEDIRAFFLWLMDVDPGWLQRLRQCSQRGCRRFFWAKRRARGGMFCSSNCRTWHWRQRQRLIRQTAAQ